MYLQVEEIKSERLFSLTKITQQPKGLARVWIQISPTPNTSVCVLNFFIIIPMHGSNAYGAQLEFSVLERGNAFAEAGGMMPAVSRAQCGQGARTCSRNSWACGKCSVIKVPKRWNRGSEKGNSKYFLGHRRWNIRAILNEVGEQIGSGKPQRRAEKTEGWVKLLLVLTPHSQICACSRWCRSPLFNELFHQNTRSWMQAQCVGREP